MIRRNLVLILRDISRNKTSFAINTIGLSAGMASATVIGIWVNNEMTAENYTYRSLILLSALALVIVFIASINYSNLSSARKIKRLKESGLKKGFRAVKRKLIIQYIMEAILMSVLSLLSAIGLVAMGLPGFNKFIHKDLALDLDAHMVFFVLGIEIFSLLVAAAYPILVLRTVCYFSIRAGL